MDEQPKPRVKPEPIKVLIGIPSRGEFKRDTTLGLAFMLHSLTSNPIIEVDGKLRFVLWGVQVVSSSNIAGNRQKLVDAAIASEVDYLLFLDDDMTFPDNLLHIWLTENRPVIAANCPTRAIPCYPTARNRSAEPRGVPVYSDVAPYRWGKVWRVGTGIMLLRMDVLKSLPRPAFTMRWEPLIDDYIGEDWALCEHLEAAGYPIIVDHKISLDIGHTGDMTFTHDHAKATRIAENRSGIIAPVAKVQEPEKELIVVSK